MFRLSDKLVKSPILANVFKEVNAQTIAGCLSRNVSNGISQSKN